MKNIRPPLTTIVVNISMAKVSKNLYGSKCCRVHDCQYHYYDDHHHSVSQSVSQSVNLHAGRRPLRGAGAERNSNLLLVLQALDFKHCTSLLCKINKSITCMLPISGMLGISRPIFPSHDPSKSFQLCAPSVWWSAHTSASWKPFQSTSDPGSGWQTCNVRSEFPVLTKTCLRPTLQVKSFTEIKDASVPAVQDLMPRHVPVQSRRGTQQST